MESTFADLRSKYDTPRPSTSNIKMAWPQSQPHEIDMSTFNVFEVGNEDRRWHGWDEWTIETSEINQNFCGIYKSVVISMNFEIAEFLFKHY